MQPESPKPLTWVGSSKRDYMRFPDQVQDDMGYALFVAQRGERPPNAKPLRGFKGAGVLELVEHYDGNAYRTVYTVRFAQRVYVLHAFRKSPNEGLRRPRVRSGSLSSVCGRRKKIITSGSNTMS